MVTVRVLPDDRLVDSERGETVLDALLRAGIPHAHACGGVARCSTCRVEVSAGLGDCTERTAAEAALAGRLRFPREIRLACQTPAGAPLTVRRLVLDEDDVAVVNQLVPGQPASAVGELVNVAILFADVVAFTPFAASLPPYDVVHALNRYFTEMGKVIAAEGGRIDNYMGDGLLAVFARDVAQGREGGAAAPAKVGAALRAVRAGLGMLGAVDRLAPYLTRAYGRRFDIRVGVHVGDVVHGAIGARGARRTSIIGDAVNVASRIEAASKRTGTRLLVSAAVFEELAGAVVAGGRFEVDLAGKHGQFVLHEIVGLKA